MFTSRVVTSFQRTTKVCPHQLVSRHLCSSSVELGFINMVIRLEDETQFTLKARSEQTLLEALDASDLSDVWDGGACGGLCQCSTCRVILSPSSFAKLAVMQAEEEDMLESSAAQEEESDGQNEYLQGARLACQIKLHSGPQTTLIC